MEMIILGSLLQIRDVVQQFADAAGAALKLDVEVVDDNYMWIAGTGRIKELIGKRIMQQGIINRYLFKEKNSLIVEKPGCEDNCLGCPRYGKCTYKKAVYTVIKCDNETIGVIGLSAMTKEQAELIDSNKYEMLDFIDKIANLISAKVKEDLMLKQVKSYAELMTNVIDNINRGVIIVDKNNRIIDVNNYIENKLDMIKGDLVSKGINDVFPKISLHGDEDLPHKQYREIRFSVRGKSRDMLYIKKLILVNNQIEYVLYTFEDYKDTRDMVYSLSERHNKISFEDIFGINPMFVTFKEKVRYVAKNDSTILLTGETGTGKELFARAIHSTSPRANKPFVAINCGAIPETLIESELFGYEKGAFTGANTLGKHGKFYLADKGTIFLDEVETMPLYLQIKLLRAIERREIERIGGVNSIPIDVRIIAATNVPLDTMVAKGEFREDLYHRLSVIPLFIPPLRERGEDILYLANHFVDKFSKKFGKEILGLSRDVKDIFINYKWSGNIRELQNTIEYGINMEMGSHIEVQNLPYQFRAEKEGKRSIMTLDEVEKRHIQMALNNCGWDENGRIRAAELLGISRSTIYRKIKKYKLSHISN